MSQQKKKPNGCGCANIPISLVLLILGGGWWWFSQKSNQEMIAKLLPQVQTVALPFLNSDPTPSPSPSLITAPVVPKVSNPSPKQSPTLINAPVVPKVSSSSSSSSSGSNSSNSSSPTSQKKALRSNNPSPNPSPNNPSPQTPWEKKVIRGIYLGRYHITNNADEKTIRNRVRHYRSQGFNTIIHGVWGNGCTMYNSKVMQQKFGFKSCPNKFQDQWLDWLIDEAHKQGMQVHAYFEKGIKIDKNSPIFDLTIARKWVVPGVDRTYPGIEHYVLDVEVPEVANFFKDISVEFVKKYPQIDAVQWDDYLGYHAELPGKVDRTANLTKFVQQMISGMKQANPKVSFDICHHNPYWAKKYFAADWSNWNVDRAFIQVYNDANFQDELKYVKNSAGIAISEKQFNRLTELVNNRDVKSILVFPVGGKPEETASKLKSLTQAKN